MKRKARPRFPNLCGVYKYSKHEFVRTESAKLFGVTLDSVSSFIWMKIYLVLCVKANDLEIFSWYVLSSY